MNQERRSWCHCALYKAAVSACQTAHIDHWPGLRQPQNNNKSSSSTSNLFPILHHYMNVQTVYTEARRLRSPSLDIRRTHLSTVGDRAFPVAATRLWNSLPSHVTAASLSPSSALVLNHIRSHFFIPLPDFFHLNSARGVTRHFWC